MKNKLITVISELKLDGSIFSFDEAATKQAIVLRLLSVLGWNQYDVNEVRPEYSTGSGRVDYSLRLSDVNKAFIEVKRTRESLDDHQEQLLNYSFHEGIKLSVLTNGLTWWFYLPLREGSWEQRRFYTVDLLQQSPDDISRRLVDFLSKDNVDSGAAIENAEQAYNSQQRTQIIEESLPKAWNMIISEPDELLLELIGETSESIGGFRPDLDTVGSFLAQYADRFVIRGEQLVARPGQSEDQRYATAVSSSGSYLGKSINGFRFRGKPYRAANWKDLLSSLSEIIYDDAGSEFEKVLSLAGRKRNYFSRNEDGLREPRQIGFSEFYVETHWSADGMVKLCYMLLALFGYNEQDLEIELR